MTDGETHPHAEGYGYFWDVIEEASLAMGFASVKARASLPMWLLWTLAAVCELVQWCLGITLKLNYFNVKMLTMHRWFNISAAERDLELEVARQVVRVARLEVGRRRQEVARLRRRRLGDRLTAIPGREALDVGNHSTAVLCGE